MEVNFDENRRKAKQMGIETEVSSVYVEVPKDAVIDEREGTFKLETKVRLARNEGELIQLFDQFCRNNVGGYAKYDSTPVLRGAIENAMEKVFGITTPNEIAKIVLCKQNKNHFENLIKRSLEKYSIIRKEKENGKEEEYQHVVWTLPKERMYNSDSVHSTEGEIYRHALTPYFEQNNASKPEKEFSRLLDEQTEWVDWWYKNGDEGKQHFAVGYLNSEGRKRCFYVDFIVRLKNGTMCLFDTKTPGSDMEAPAKHNALQAYIDEHNERGRKMVGGVLIKDGGNWYYPGGMIEHTHNTQGWTMLDLSKI